MQHQLVLSSILALTVLVVSAKHEFGEAEPIHLFCEEGSSITIHSARYGHLGCNDDVTTEVLSWCPVGSSECELDYIWVDLDHQRPCPWDFQNFLEIDYDCEEWI